jgi:hypothetical protein
MSITATTTIDVELELDYRSAHGVEVTLLWHPTRNTVTVEVHDRKAGECFRLSVDRDKALDAFHHPYAYRS